MTTPIFHFGAKTKEFEHHLKTIKYAADHSQKLALCILIDQRKVRDEKGYLCAFWSSIYHTYIANVTTGFTFIPVVAKGSSFNGDVPSPLRVRAEVAGTEDKGEAILERIGEADYAAAVLLLHFEQILSNIQVVSNAPEQPDVNEVLTHACLGIMHKITGDTGAEPVLAAFEHSFEPPKKMGRVVFSFDNPNTTADGEEKSYA